MEKIATGGIGLCLHTPEHTAVSVPTMRIFETTMAGAVAIADRHPFIEENFKDAVLYLDTNSPEKDARAIRRYVHWIRRNPEAAIDLARRAHDVCLNFSLEKLLSSVIAGHSTRLSQRSRSIETKSISQGDGRLQVIVRTGGRDLKYLKRAIDSLVKQDYPNIEAIVIVYENHEKVADFLSKITDLKYRIVNSKKTGYRSTQLFEGLRCIEAEFFAILDDDDIVYPSHYSDLIGILSLSNNFDVAYSGSNKIVEYNNSFGKDTTVSVAHYQEFSRVMLHKFDNYITSNSYIGRTSALFSVALGDLRLVVAEDFYLLLKLQKHSDFVFSGNVTCGFYWREDSKDNSSFLDRSILATAAERVRTLTAHDFSEQRATTVEFQRQPRELQTLGKTKLKALLRHPLNSDKRRAYRDKRKVYIEYSRA